MTIGGVSIILIGGIFNFLLLLFQLSTGLRLIKTPLKVHKYTGIALIITSAAHGGLAIISEL